MALAFFGQGMSSITWPIIADTAPPSLLGTTGGIFNMCGNLAGIVTPLVVGIIIGRTHSFEPALVFVCAVALLGAFSYIFIVGKLRQISLSGT
jgi:ACS family D-galactonate transporter-like MFS transporter